MKKVIMKFSKCVKSFLNKNIYVMSFNSEIIKLIKKKCPFVKCGFLIGSIINSSHISDDMDFIAISSYCVNKVFGYDKPIFVWAINGKKKYIDLVGKMNDSTYYIVDYPVRFLYN